jgi:hypothetical protein
VRFPAGSFAIFSKLGIDKAAAIWYNKSWERSQTMARSGVVLSHIGFSSGKEVRALSKTEERRGVWCL